MARYRIRAKSRALRPQEAARAGLCWEAADVVAAANEVLETLGVEVYQCCDGYVPCASCARDAQVGALAR